MTRREACFRYSDAGQIHIVIILISIILHNSSRSSMISVFKTGPCLLQFLHFFVLLNITKHCSLLFIFHFFFTLNYWKPETALLKFGHMIYKCMTGSQEKTEQEETLPLTQSGDKHTSKSECPCPWNVQWWNSVNFARDLNIYPVLMFSTDFST